MSHDSFIISMENCSLAMLDLHAKQQEGSNDKRKK
jgi:hypothetical protein